jgi:hypothetical protein
MQRGEPVDQLELMAVSMAALQSMLKMLGGGGADGGGMDPALMMQLMNQFAGGQGVPAAPPSQP